MNGKWEVDLTLSYTIQLEIKTYGENSLSTKFPEKGGKMVLSCVEGKLTETWIIQARWIDLCL